MTGRATAVKPAWPVLLSGSLRDEAGDRLEEIFGAVGQREHRDPTTAWADQEGSATLMYTYAADAGLAPGDVEARLDRAWSRALDRVERCPMRPGLFAGCTEIGWIAEHLSGPLDHDDGEEGALDRAIAAALEGDSWSGPVDLVSGLVGFGVHALEQLPRRSAMHCLTLVQRHLAATATSCAPGRSWMVRPQFLPADRRVPAPKWDLGIAHGTAGAIGFLAASIASAPQEPHLLPLLEDTVAWVLAQQLPDGSPSCFPARIFDGERPTPSRTAWCYGDPGMAMALLLAGRVARRPDWEARARLIGKAAALRPAPATEVADAGLCHGSAGLAQIFGRLYQYTGESVFAEGALAWLERTIRFRDEGPGNIAGYRLHLPPHVQATEGDQLGLLTGVSGVALTLLAALSGAAPDWDRILLLSFRGADGAGRQDRA